MLQKTTEMKLSKVFKLAKAKLAKDGSWWDMSYEALRSSHICTSIQDSDAPMADKERARAVVYELLRQSVPLHILHDPLLGPPYSLERWLTEVHGISYHPFSSEYRDKMQATRHAWIDHLIAHYEAKGA